MSSSDCGLIDLPNQSCQFHSLIERHDSKRTNCGGVFFHPHVTIYPTDCMKIRNS